MPAAELCRELTLKKEDGRIMLYLIRKALPTGRTHRKLFEQGEYAAIDARRRPRREHLRLRTQDGQRIAVVVAVPRFLSRDHVGHAGAALRSNRVGGRAS